MAFALVFPGQGSQAPGMLADLASEHPIVQATFDEASTIVDRDLWRIAQDGPAAELDRTEVTQPAMLAADVAVLRVWRERGGGAGHWLAGHSLGEYAALVAAGGLTFDDAVAAVAARAARMQAAVPEGEGAMAAVLGLADADVAAVCERAADGRVVEPANYNSPGQVVIAGHRDAVERAVDLAKEAGARRAVTLAVSVPSHCSLMRSAADEFGKRLAALELTPGEIPVVHNVDARPAASPEALRAALTEQLYRPVRWTQSVEWMISQGCTAIVECGPGKVLSGLARRIDKRLTAVATQDIATLDAALEEAARHAD